MKNKLKSFALLITVFLVAMTFGYHSNANDSQNSQIPFFAKFPNIDLSTWLVSHGWAVNDGHSCEWRKANMRGEDGKLVMHLRENGGRLRDLGCAEIRTRKVKGYGRYEARMKTAKGSGLNTAFFTFTGPAHGVPEHDEIDFEFLGKNSRTVDLNYYRNGKSMGPWIIDLGFDASKSFNNYAFEWYPDKIIWYVNGKKVQQTKEGAEIPKYAGNLFFSLWSSSPRLNKWMGRFKYTGRKSAQIEWVKFTPFDHLKQKAKTVEK